MKSVSRGQWLDKPHHDPWYLDDNNSEYGLYTFTWPVPQVGSSISSKRISSLPWKRTARMISETLVRGIALEIVREENDKSQEDLR